MNSFVTHIRVRGEMSSLASATSTGWTAVTVCHNKECTWADVRPVSPGAVRADQRDGMYIIVNATVTDGGCEPYCDTLVGLGGFRTAKDGDVFEVRAKHSNEKPVTLVHDVARYVPGSLGGCTGLGFETDHRGNPPWPLR